MTKRKKLLIKLAIVAVLAVLLVFARDFLLERSHRDYVSPLNPATKRYDCEEGRFLLLYFFAENGQQYVEVSFNDIQVATLTKAEVGGRYTVGKGTLELFETNGGWQVYQRGQHLYKECRLAPGQ